MISLDLLKKELKPFKNTLVIDSFQIVRLVDVVEEEDDYYWIYDNGGKITYVSCVFNWVSLKKHLPVDEYESLVNLWNINNPEQVI